MVTVRIDEEFGGIAFDLRGSIPLLRRHGAVLRPRRDRLRDRWVARYAAAFGRRGALKARARRAVFGEWLDLFLEALAAEDLPGHYRKMVEFGRRLSAMGVTLEEIILSLHFFEEISMPVLMREHPDAKKAAKVIYTLDLLFHNELACLALAFFYRYRSEIRRLEKLRDDLTHMIVHDLKSPINVVTGGGEALLDEIREKGRIEDPVLLGLIARAGNQMWRMVNNLLDIGKMESGTFVVRPAMADLEDVIAEAIAEQRLRLEESGLTVSFERTGLPDFRFDRDLVRRVAANLLDNAVKHSPRGGTIRVAAAREGRRAIVRVEDRGPGVADTDKERIFEKFAQAGESAAGRVAGSGLGLAFCKLAVEASGGAIAAEDASPNGLAVQFTLPLRPR